jgi:hypothetical protein
VEEAEQGKHGERKRGQHLALSSDEPAASILKAEASFTDEGSKIFRNNGNNLPDYSVTSQKTFHQREKYYTTKPELRPRHSSGG